MLNVILYSRHDCHLCDAAKEDLEMLSNEFPHTLVEIDIAEHPELAHEYGDCIPVIEVGPYRLSTPFDLQDLRMTLSAARDRAGQLTRYDPDGYKQKLDRGWSLTKTEKLTFWFSNHYIFILNLFVIIYVGIPFLAPVLVKTGWTKPARMIYTVYGGVCHQFSFRSWFLFGQQFVYPRSAAHVDNVLSYGEATGLDESDLLEARRFIGNEQLGYKVAFCERDASIYLGFFAFGLIFALGKRKIPVLPWYLWILFGILPIAADGFSQLLSQPPFHMGVYRESTPFLRVITGALFGLLTAWFGYPMVEEGMADTRLVLAKKIARVNTSLSTGVE